MPLLFPERQDLERIARSSGGDLAELPLSLLLLSLADCERTCVLEIQSKDVVKRISVQRGIPIQCRSNVLHDTFACYLRDSGTISEQTYIDCLEEATARRSPIGDVLVERRILSSDQILTHLQKLLAKVLLDAFAWAEGRYQIFDELIGAAAPLRVKVPQLVLTGITRFAPRELISATVAGLGKERAALRPKSEILAGELRLGANENRLLQVLKEPQTVAQCSELLALPVPDVERSLYALGLLGIACRETDAAKKVQETPAVDDSDSAFYMMRAAPRQKLNRNEIASLFLNHLRMDPFELLEVQDDTHPEVVEQSYLDLVVRIVPWIAEAGSLRTTDQARTLLLALASAYARVADDEVRQLLDQGKLLPRLVDDAVELTETRQMIDPEEQFVEGLRLKEAQSFEQARACFELASDCNPQSGLYRAEAAYCLFKGSPKRAVEALELLTESRRIDPNCGLSCLYAGEISIQLNQIDEAYTWLRAANVLMTPDQRPIDKLSELRELREQNPA